MRAHTTAAENAPSTTTASIPAVEAYPRSGSTAIASSTAGTPGRAGRSTHVGNAYARSARPHADHPVAFATSATPNVTETTAAASAPTSSRPPTSPNATSEVASTADSATPCATRHPGHEALLARRSTSADPSSAVRARKATEAVNPRERPNGASASAPASGSPDANAATDTTTSVPRVRYVRNPTPRPTPYRNDAIPNGKNDRHQFGTWRRSCGTGTRAPNTSARNRVATPATIANPASHGASRSA